MRPELSDIEFIQRYFHLDAALENHRDGILVVHPDAFDHHPDIAVVIFGHTELSVLGQFHNLVKLLIDALTGLAFLLLSGKQIGQFFHLLGDLLELAFISVEGILCTALSDDLSAKLLQLVDFVLQAEFFRRLIVLYGGFEMPLGKWDELGELHHMVIDRLHDGSVQEALLYRGGMMAVPCTVVQTADAAPHDLFLPVPRPC